MIRLKPGRTIAILGIAALTSAATPGAPTAPGITFDMTVSSSMNPQPPNGPGGYTLTTRGMAANGSVRTDIVSVEGGQGVYVVGDYILTTEKGSLMVHPATKTYTDILDRASAMLNSLPPQLAAQLSFTDVKGTSEKVPGSEPIEGHATEHYRTTLGYSMNIMGQSVPSQVVSDVWVAKLSVNFANPFAGGAKSAVTEGPMGEIIKKQMELSNATVSSGVALKTSSATTVTAQGQSIVTTITSEMKNIKDVDVDLSKFAIPDGYTKSAK